VYGQFNANITNGLSKMEIVQNGVDDYSLKLWSGDRSKNVTYVRLQGPQAEAGVQQTYFLFQNLQQIAGQAVE
jgi:hypothetical protein